jgi:hypothetical protein
MGPPPWLYVAPEVEGDEVLQDRLAKYRRDQDAIWRVKNAPLSLLDALTPDVVDGHGAVVIDRFSVWIAAQLRARPPAQDAELQDEIERLAGGCSTWWAWPIRRWPRAPTGWCSWSAAFRCGCADQRGGVPGAGHDGHAGRLPVLGPRLKRGGPSVDGSLVAPCAPRYHRSRMITAEPCPGC